MRAWKLSIVVFALLCGAGGCMSYEEGARQYHVGAYSCPAHRVSVRPRPDLDAYDVTFGDLVKPSEEVLNDPERYAVWKKEDEKRRATYRKNGEVYESTGCGQTAILLCFHPQNVGGRGGMDPTRVACAPLKAGPDVVY